MNCPDIADAGLSGGVAIVTGGSRGIGRAIVEVLAAAGMDVVLTYRQDATAAAEVVATGQGHRITAEPLDVRDAGACAALVEKVVDRAGRIDLLVNNAGVIRDNPLTIIEDEEFRVVLETNLVGTFNMARAVAPHMIAAAPGQDHQYQFGRRGKRRPRADQLRGKQRRRQWLHPVTGSRAGTARHYGERCGAGVSLKPKCRAKYASGLATR